MGSKKRNNEVLKAVMGTADKIKSAKYNVGEVVRHRHYGFRGVVFDIDPTFDNTEEWLLAIPEEIRPDREQPFYHLLAENADSEYIAYVSEQNLVIDQTGTPLRHPQIEELFHQDEEGQFQPLFLQAH
ncbi:Hemimethylated DNA binding protein [Candidatus Filomicrobium marinum]|uniref:Heat shock protein HspQ n=3 Tax=Hyphomicrobiaceae TaxID=45401 RepID=A0A0D6JJI2_9HYPH|nr:Hemimethylated DNA binding protein [Candidatus Filomicrobium marinum]CPR21810.1 Hemimethylated DNA binding protein [Candidatus Filomicrobium marinum]SDP51311.1 heat shock protein HspQ [Filomicrobium insigne]